LVGLLDRASEKEIESSKEIAVPFICVESSMIEIESSLETLFVMVNSSLKEIESDKVERKPVGFNKI